MSQVEISQASRLAVEGSYHGPSPQGLVCQHRPPTDADAVAAVIPSTRAPLPIAARAHPRGVGRP
jgi:hypothetical protein